MAHEYGWLASMGCAFMGAEEAQAAKEMRRRAPHPTVECVLLADPGLIGVSYPPFDPKTVKNVSSLPRRSRLASANLVRGGDKKPIAIKDAQRCAGRDDIEALFPCVAGGARCSIFFMDTVASGQP